MPVVKTRPLYGTIGDVEAQRTDKMQRASRGGAGAGDITAILGYFRFDQYDVQHDRITLLLHKRQLL